MDALIEKAWGKEDTQFNGPLCFKILYLDQGYRCSMHHHKVKDEVFLVWSGVARIEANGKSELYGAGDWVHIKPGTWHRFTGLRNTIIYEFSTHDDPADSYRMEGQLSGRAED